MPLEPRRLFATEQQLTPTENLHGLSCGCAGCRRRLPADAGHHRAAGGGSAAAAAADSMAAALPLDLQSRPGAFATLYLDFDGDAGATYHDDARLRHRRRRRHLQRRRARKHPPDLGRRRGKVFAVQHQRHHRRPRQPRANRPAAVLIGGNGAWRGTGAGGVATVGGFAAATESVAHRLRLLRALQLRPSTSPKSSPTKPATFGLNHQTEWSGSDAGQRVQPGQRPDRPDHGQQLLSAARHLVERPHQQPPPCQDDLAILVELDQRLRLPRRRPRQHDQPRDRADRRRHGRQRQPA